MAVNIEPLAFDDGGQNLTVYLRTPLYTNGPAEFTATSRIDLQDGGVLVENVNIADGNSMVFVPWSNVSGIAQHE